MPKRNGGDDVYRRLLAVRRSRVGTGTNPGPWGFGGTLGYYTDSVPGSLYVRARILLPNYGRWLTVTPWWPAETPYAYGAGAPSTFVDPDGAMPHSVHHKRKKKHKKQYPRLWPPGLPNPCLATAIDKWCGGVNLDFYTMYAIFDCIIEGESSWTMKPTTIDDGPQAGSTARGPMQITPSIGPQCVQWGYAHWATDPCENIECGVRSFCGYMRESQEKLAKEGDPRGRAQGLPPRPSPPPWIHGPICRGQENAIYKPKNQFDLCLLQRWFIVVD